MLEQTLVAGLARTDRPVEAGTRPTVLAGQRACRCGSPGRYPDIRAIPAQPYPGSGRQPTAAVVTESRSIRTVAWVANMCSNGEVFTAGSTVCSNLSMSQATLSEGGRTDAAPADAERAPGPARSGLAWPSAARCERYGRLLKRGSVAGASLRGRRDQPGARPTGRPRAATASSALTGPPRSPGAVPHRGRRRTARRTPGLNVTARAPC
jgi:hypothetical protein